MKYMYVKFRKSKALQQRIHRHGSSSHSGDVRQSQADIISMREMQRAMDRWLTVFVGPELDMWNATNRCWMQSFNAIAAIGAMQLDTDGEDRADNIFRNMAVRVSFEAFIGVLPEEGKKTSVIWVSRASDWMTCIIEDL